MTDQAPQPAVAPESPQQAAYDLIKAVVAILALVGVAIPAALTTQSAEMQLAAIAVTAVGGGATLLSYISHRAKSQVIATQAAKLALVDAKAKAPARTRNVN